MNEGLNINSAALFKTHEHLPGLTPMSLFGKDPQSRITLYTEGDALYADMLKAIANAQHHIRMECYIFATDEIGWRFARALVEAASKGITVQLHIDAAGSTPIVSTVLEQYLVASDVQWRWFHRWCWQKPWRYNRRNHRKLLIIDEQQFFLGGFNLHEESSRLYVGEKRWRDTHLSIMGSLTKDAIALFETLWHGRIRRPSLQTHSINMLLPNHGIRCRRRLHCTLTDRIKTAQKCVYVTTPYFVPDIKMQLALKSAARRGIDVRLLLPSKTDVRITQWAAHAAYAGLLAAGVRIFEYQARFLHAKTIVIDQIWSMVGTANMDYRSFFINYELNLVSQDKTLAKSLMSCYLTDIEQSEEIKGHDWHQRHRYRLVFESIAWAARRWL